MKFSIITVCYNSARSIRDTFESVLQQDFEDYEYLVVDGASRDETVAIIREYEPRFAGKMRWISEPDGGIYEAMNKGLAMADGEFIGILNSDDRYEPGALRAVAAATLARPEGDVFYGITRYAAANGQEKMLLRSHHTSLIHDTICHQACFVSNQLYRRMGGYDLQYRIASDYDFLLRAYLDGAAFQPVDHIVAMFREGGACYRQEARGVSEKLQIRLRHQLCSKVTAFCVLLQFKATKFAQKLLSRQA